MTTAFTSPADAAAWLAARVVAGVLRTDSRAVAPGDGFIAWPGRTHDARRFVQAALDTGAAACLVEAEGAEALGLRDARIATLPGLQAAAGAVASAFHGHPSAQLQVLAVTGTNGKTSTAWWTAQALAGLGQRCGVVGTLGIGTPGQVGHTGLTTPDAVTLQAAFKSFADRGFQACAIEASSIGIAEHRLAAVQVAVALFTNFTRDHLDFHGDMATYWAAKRQLFAWPGLRAAVVNIDDVHGSELAAELHARQRGAASDAMDVWTVSLRGPARLQALGLRYADGGLVFDVREDGGSGEGSSDGSSEGSNTVTVRTALVGDFNASNVLVVIGGLRALGMSLADAAAACAALTSVPGRLQRVPGSVPEVVVDYAHTPDALDKVLQALRPLATARNGRLWCVFGCGGNRDATKRPLMGAIAAKGADRVVVTSDNPRDEVPATILAQILAGMTGIAGIASASGSGSGSGSGNAVAVIEDRQAAIAHAVRHAADNDVVLLAGKGHEDYQDIGGSKRPFSDVAEASAALQLRARQGAAA